MTFTRRTLIESTLAAAPAARPGGRAPNFVFLLSDDQTWNDLGCYGNAGVRTPNLDRMAEEGMRFNHCYVSSPQCSPNRSSIFTGCTPHTTATSRLHTPMPDWEPSFLEPLKERGYFVGAFRKVHQGASFDRRWNFYGDRQTPFEKFFDALPAGRPFWLQLGFTDPHRPYSDGAFNPPHDPKTVRVPRFLPDLPEVRRDIAHYYDRIARMDAECGQLFEILKRRNLADNTLVIFTGDNGMPFPRAKGGCYDPGIRVPLLAWWPGRIAAGAVRDELIAHVDLPVTWLEAAGIAKPAKMQGRGFLDLLLGRPFRPRTEVFSERNWHDNFDPIRSVRTATHKLIFNAAPHFPYRPAWDLADSPTWAAMLKRSRGGLRPEHMELFNPSRPMLELYDLRSDPDEFNNLAGDPAHARTLENMKSLLSNWMHATCDYLPPAYAAPGEPRGRGWPATL
ncbi:MAG: sulfatase [Bryobacteraceae bacterium]